KAAAGVPLQPDVKRRVGRLASQPTTIDMAVVITTYASVFDRAFRVRRRLGLRLPSPARSVLLSLALIVVVSVLVVGADVAGAALSLPWWWLLPFLLSNLVVDYAGLVASRWTLGDMNSSVPALMARWAVSAGAYVSITLVGYCLATVITFLILTR